MCGWMDGSCARFRCRVRSHARMSEFGGLGIFGHGGALGLGIAAMLLFALGYCQWRWMSAAVGC